MTNEPDIQEILDSLGDFPDDPPTARRILVCGGRDYSDARRVNKVLHLLKDRYGEDIIIIHGAARGADLMAEAWAKINQIQYEGFPAKWDLHGKSAGYERNARMLKQGRPDLCFAFPGGKGTAMMSDLCHRAGVPTWVWVDGFSGKDE